MAVSNPSLITWLVFLPLIAWRIVVRVKRMTQRQRLSRYRPWVTLILFPLIVGLLALAAFAPNHPPQPLKLLWLALGLAAGCALAIYGLKRTKFEAEPGALYYTHDLKLGIALSTLFIARVLYRVGEMIFEGTQATQNTDFALSPWTLAPFGLLAGYYIVYAVGLVRWRWGVLRRKRERERGEQV